MSEVLVSVRKGGKEIDLVKRPVRATPDGPAVKYRRKLWLLEGESINIDDLKETKPDAKAVVRTNIDSREIVEEEDPQLLIVKAGSNARLMVEAGPGTGKTWTACERVSSLIRQGVPASKIWIVSYTRTAVLEIRQRIADVLENPRDAASLKIATLDSHAWALQSGFDAEATLGGDYNENIGRTLELVRSNSALTDYLGRIQHMIIDEAQDIIGQRASFVCALMAGFPETSGITIFADPAQSIYGFTEDEQKAADPRSLPEMLTADFRRTALKRVRRTSCPKLRELFTSARRKVLAKGNVAMRASHIRNDLKRLAHHEAEPANDGTLSDVSADSLVLYRHRVEVLSASAYASETPHRIRMSGMPVVIQPWIGLLFWDCVSRRVTKADFDALCATRIRPEEPFDPDSCWTLLVKEAGESEKIINLHRLRQLLGRSNPPLVFCTPEFGDKGPVLGTIHASKGREADNVVLWLPDEKTTQSDEEIQVLFVGGTRAKKTLTVGDAAPTCRYSVNGRSYRRAKGGVQLEVGRAGDLDLAGLVGTSAFVTEADATKAQSLISFTPRQKNLVAAANGDLDWRMSLETAERERIAVLTDIVTTDLKDISKKCGQWPPPRFLPYLRSAGLRTVAARPDDPLLDGLHEPWRSSGFALAPLLTGFSTGKFKGKSR